MKLYYSRGACSLVVRIIINEIGLPCEYVAVDLKTKRTENGDDFFKTNPKGAVPTLELDNKEILTENAVILQYLADSSHATTLLPPTTDFKRYRTLEWLNLMATDMHKGLGILFNTLLPQEVKDKYLIPIVKSKLKFINQHLQKNQFLMGDHFTLPDAYLFVMLTWTKIFKIDLDEYPNLLRYFNQLLTHKSIVKSLQEEGIKLTAEV